MSRNSQEKDLCNEVRGSLGLLRVESIRSMLVGVYLRLVSHVNSRVSVKVSWIDPIDLQYVNIADVQSARALTNLGKSRVHERLAKLIQARSQVEHESI